jgi:hypothetical protein
MQNNINIGKINITFSRRIPKKILKKLSSISIKSLYSGGFDKMPSALEVDPDTRTIIKVTNIKKDHTFMIATAEYENEEEMVAILELLDIGSNNTGLLITKSELENMTQEQVSDLIHNFNNLNIHKN